MSFKEDVLTLAGLEDNVTNNLEVDVAFEWANAYTKQEYLQEDAPTGYTKAVVALVLSASQSPNVTSESVGGELSVSYSDDATKAAKDYLKPYVRAVFR